MTKEQAKQEAERIVKKYSIKLIIKTVGYIDYENAAKQCAILEVQSNIDLLDKGELYIGTEWRNRKLNNLNQIKAEIELI